MTLSGVNTILLSIHRYCPNFISLLFLCDSSEGMEKVRCRFSLLAESCWTWKRFHLARSSQKCFIRVKSPCISVWWCFFIFINQMGFFCFFFFLNPIYWSLPNKVWLLQNVKSIIRGCQRWDLFTIKLLVCMVTDYFFWRNQTFDFCKVWQKRYLFCMR